MSPNIACERCGAPLTAAEAAAKTCPRCLLRVGMEVSAASAGLRRRPAPTLAELQPHFPRLELLALVGEGGMGCVYKARDRELERTVALKVLTLEGDDSAPFDERFAREARAMARLTHPNIAAVHDHGKAGPWSYLMLEYVDGENLRRVLRSRTVEPADALRWVGEICAALQYAHEHGVVHRDIKPENVLVDAKGRVKVVDFGLAKLLDRRPGEATLTQTQQSLGTWHYMAPEQYERPQSVDHRADIYSLGVVLYELLTGQVPVGRFDLPSQRIAVDVRVDEVVVKALAREPEKRYQAVSEVKSRVDDIGSGAPTLASTPKKRAPWAVWLTLGCLGAVLLLFGVFVLPMLFMSSSVEAIPTPPAAESADKVGRVYAGNRVETLRGAVLIWAPYLLMALAALVGLVSILGVALFRSKDPRNRRTGVRALFLALGLFLLGAIGLTLLAWTLSSDPPPAVQSAPIPPVAPR